MGDVHGCCFLGRILWRLLGSQRLI
jgi:hypothetical protein